MTELWGEPLAHELARGVAGVRVVPLAAIEPALDPGVHHTNPPYAIVSDRHAIAIVEGQKVAIDGPQRTDNGNRYAITAEQIAANRAELTRVAEAWGVPAPAERGGLIDTALSIMRFLAQRGSWTVYVAGHHEGLEGHIAARGGTYRWPAGLHLRSVARGIRLTCGDSERDLESLAGLADFATREAAILDAQVLWCHGHLATLGRLRPFGQAVLDAIARGVPERSWSLWVADEYFTLDAPPVVSVATPDTRATTATIGCAGDAIEVTIGTYAGRFATPAEVGARCEELAAAARAWLATPEAEPPVRDLDYYR